MIIDTERKVFLTHLRRLITLLAFATIVMLIMLIGKRPNTYFGLTKYNWALIICSVYIISSVYESMLGLNYIYFNDENGIITFRYFSLSYFNSRKNLIEIPINDFMRYEIKTSMGGQKTKITLYCQIKNKEAKYPSVSLSLMNKAEIARLIATLDKYSKK
jgi:hypothetical protein